MLSPEFPLYPFVQNRKVVVLSQNNRVEQAAKAMRDQDIGAVVIADDDGHMTGMVTDRDLVCEVLACDLPPDTPLREIMSPELCGVREEATLEDVIQVMTDNGVRRVPILREISNGRSRCMGIITLDDLISQKAIDTASLARIVGAQVHSLAIRAGYANGSPLRKLRRKEQTLALFNKCIARETHVPESVVVDVSKAILSLVVRRITSREAAQFISQLPYLMQDELLDQEAGPDRSITADMLLRAVKMAMQGHPSDPREVCQGFWRSMAETISPGELHDVYSQLPKDMQELFAPSVGRAALKRQAA